ncbi:hypothetical protein FRC00_000110, partial [Tulasnella sp. 408]
MLGLSFTRATTSATHPASPPDQNQKSKRGSPLTRTYRKLKKAMMRSGPREVVSSSKNDSTHHAHSIGRQRQAAPRPAADTNKPLPPIPSTPTQPTTTTCPRRLPRGHQRVASALPTATTAAPILSNRDLLSNPSELDRHLSRYPRPKIVYTPAEAKVVVKAFLANAKYEEDLARNNNFGRKVPKPREERPPSRRPSFKAQLASSTYSTTCKDIRELQQVPMHGEWQDAAAQVATSSSKLESSPPADCSITMDEMEMTMQDPTQLES